MGLNSQTKTVKSPQNLNMGAAHGQPSHRHYARAFDSFSYAPITAHRTESSYSHRFEGKRSKKSDNSSQKLLNTAYHGKWMMKIQNCLTPAPRIGQCSVYDPVRDSLVIAYGLSDTGQYLSDAWSLSLSSLTWTCLATQLLSPRQYPSAVLVGRRMFIFGGAMGPQFFADLHYIDLDSGEVRTVDVSGHVPVPRTSPAMFASTTSIFLWSGWDGRAHGGVYSINPNDGVWRRYDKSHTGVPAPACCWHKGKYYVYGGNAGTPMSVFDPETGEIEPLVCIGTEPSHELAHATLVSCDEYIMLIGGESTVQYMHLYALDVKRKWWFAFHVRPDNETLCVSDGAVNKTGLFMLPREHSASIVYSPRERHLVSVMGSKMLDPPPTFIISVGEALACLHLRNDMLDLFSIDH